MSTQSSTPTQDPALMEQLTKSKLIPAAGYHQSQVESRCPSWLQFGRNGEQRTVHSLGTGRHKCGDRSHGQSTEQHQGRRTQVNTQLNAIEGNQATCLGHGGDETGVTRYTAATQKRAEPRSKGQRLHVFVGR
eukprot:876395-Amphidinium_carterae.1